MGSQCPEVASIRPCRERSVTATPPPIPEVRGGRFRVPRLPPLQRQLPGAALGSGFDRGWPCAHLRVRLVMFSMQFKGLGVVVS